MAAKPGLRNEQITKHKLRKGLGAVVRSKKIV